MQGSSPLSRGILPQSHWQNEHRRIIPALAGNTMYTLPSCSCTWDHPRSRGEYRFATCAAVIATGSSPLSRGILRPSAGRREVRRIIPALAGNTTPCQSVEATPSDHPRSRGEYCTCSQVSALAMGSSPLSRGIRARPATGSGSRRIIPALAGNTLAAAALAWAGGDHPRSRGEYAAQAASDAVRAGSSPLSRGILPAPGWLAHQGRIIPALAGNTSGLDACITGLRDHPRSRGEYDLLQAEHCDVLGSSPLSRGIRRHRRSRRRRHRIIPALAGNTNCYTTAPSGVSDHPRSRGEYVAWFTGTVVPAGSSPLSRGIRCWPGSAIRRSRIIPALAGNTNRG